MSEPATDAASTPQGMVEATASLPEQVADRGAHGARARRPARARQGRARRRAGHGRQRHRRRHPGRRRAARSCRCRSSCRSPTSCPPFVGEGSLVFAISFSGNTEETVEAATEAAVQGAEHRRHHQRRRAGPAGRGLGHAGRPGAVHHPAAACRARRHGHPAADRARGHRPVPRRRPVDRRRGRAAQVAGVDRLTTDKSEAAELARRIGRTIPLDLRRRRHRRHRRPALEDAVQRERQGAGVLQRPSRAVPQRGLRLGPARRRHPPDDHRWWGCATTSSTRR